MTDFDHKQPSYPENVYVHGNGFVQIKLMDDGAGLNREREARIHIWHPSLMKLTQNVNTRIHNHRFGFISTVLRGSLDNYEVIWWVKASPLADDTYEWWIARDDRLATGNRPLVQYRDGWFGVRLMAPTTVEQGESYVVEPKIWHYTEPLTEYVVTLMTKTHVIPESEFKASVFCRVGRQPDQTFDRRQIPWGNLEKLIRAALEGTPFETTDLW